MTVQPAPVGAASDENVRLVIPFAKATFAVLVWGASFIATKLALREVAPVTVVWLRFGIGVGVLGITVLARRQFAWPGRQQAGYLALLGLIGIAFHQWLQSTGLVTAQASTTAWIIATTPVFMAMLSWLVLREKLGWRGQAGILLAALGVLLVVTRGDLGALALGRVGTPGDLLILISAPNWAVFSVLSRRGLAHQPPARMMFYVMGFGWALTTVQFLVGPGPADIGRLSLVGWLAVVFLGLFCSGLAYVFWYDVLQALPASQAGAFLYLEPLVAVVVAGVVLGEPLVFAALLGGGLILAGVWLVNRPGLKR